MSYHCTNKDEARVLRRLQRQAGVKNVVLGPFSNCRHKYKPGMVRSVRTAPGVETMRVYSGDGVRTLYVYTT